MWVNSMMCVRRRRPAQKSQNHAFIAHLRVPSPRPGTNLNPALVEEAFTLAALKWGGLVVGLLARLVLAWEVVALAAASSPPRARSFRIIPVELESHPSGEPATSQLASLIQFQVCDQLHWQVQVRDRSLSSRVPSF